jgi:hypothetical protein
MKEESLVVPLSLPEDVHTLEGSLPDPGLVAGTTNRDLAAWSDDKFRVADNPRVSPLITTSAFLGTNPHLTLTYR